jgi:hypothetical protein
VSWYNPFSYSFFRFVPQAANAACEGIAVGSGNTSFLMGNLSCLVQSVSPMVGVTLLSVKTGSRISKIYRSFLFGGYYNPSFYLNCGAASLGCTSLGLQGVAYLTLTACPPLAALCYSGSAVCSATADGIDNINCVFKPQGPLSTLIEAALL